MNDHWAVTVERSGEKVVTIETNCLCGRDIGTEDTVAIRNAAHHLLAFIGDPLTEQVWQPISSAPPLGMFIWAAPKPGGGWSLGLAYRNVSGGWSDAYGSDAPSRATHWTNLPDPSSLPCNIS